MEKCFGYVKRQRPMVRRCRMRSSCTTIAQRNKKRRAYEKYILILTRFWRYFSRVIEFLARVKKHSLRSTYRAQALEEYLGNCVTYIRCDVTGRDWNAERVNRNRRLFAAMRRGMARKLIRQRAKDGMSTWPYTSSFVAQRFCDEIKLQCEAYRSREKIDMFTHGRGYVNARGESSLTPLAHPGACVCSKPSLRFDDSTLSALCESFYSCVL